MRRVVVVGIDESAERAALLLQLHSLQRQFQRIGDLRPLVCPEEALGNEVSDEEVANGKTSARE